MLDNPIVIAVAIGVGAIVVIVIGILALFSKFYRKVKQGEALIVSTMQEVEVTFTGRIVLPIVHRAEVMDISVKALELEPSNEAARTGLAAAKAREFSYAAVIRNYIALPGEVG